MTHSGDGHNGYERAGHGSSWAIPLVLLVVSVLVFWLVQVVPGDPGRNALGPYASAAQVAAWNAEHGLDALVARNVAAGRLSFSADPAQAASRAEVVFLAVGTPQGADGHLNLTHLERAARYRKNQWVVTAISVQASSEMLSGIFAVSEHHRGSPSS